ncbi:hypothetical protein [Neisseria meningitidis]|nr:hypothetical protein [Neisseria meningitidis]
MPSKPCPDGICLSATSRYARHICSERSCRRKKQGAYNSKTA